MPEPATPYEIAEAAATLGADVERYRRDIRGEATVRHCDLAPFTYLARAATLVAELAESIRGQRLALSPDVALCAIRYRADAESPWQYLDIADPAVRVIAPGTERELLFR